MGSSNTSGGESTTSKCGSKGEWAGFKMPKFPQVNADEIIGYYKKNMETLSTISKMSMEVCQNITKLQMSFFQQMMADVKESHKQSSSNTKAEDHLHHGTEAVKNHVSKSINHGKQISNALSSAGTQVVDLMTKHMNDRLDETKSKLTKVVTSIRK